MTKTKYIYLDTETTGLIPTQHWAWEVAWAVDDGPVKHAYLPHTITGADLEALEINRYMSRGPVHYLHPEGQRPPQPNLYGLREDLAGAILVGANPGFDVGMLTTAKDNGPAPLELDDFSHRHIDVRTQAMVMLGEDYPGGLATTVTALRSLYDLELHVPDHTAAGDVEAARDVHRAVRAWRRVVSRALARA